MLKHIPAILTPDLLKILMEMGYGDEIVIADGNFFRWMPTPRSRSHSWK